ncbi:MAG TPA: TonB family protein [Sphingomonas sp.]|nr:TonB family protein [Sphingomonas sp.]
MSYSDQTERRSPASIAAVVGVHIAIGYALISGLAYKIIHLPPVITEGRILPEEPPPPPKHELTPPKSKPTTKTTIIPPERTVDPSKTVEVQPLTFPEPTFPTIGGGGTTEIVPPPQPKPDHSRSVKAGTDRGRWITPADYPSRELREGITGTVTIATLIGTNGRVQSCEVVKSSGSKALDEVTCRLYAKRAHFTPALDADGNPIAARGTDRFRWEIPE